MTRPTHYLAIDLGAESGRAMLGTLASGQLSLEEIHRFANKPACLPDGLHWDVLQQWDEITNGISLAVNQRKVDLSSLAVDTWGVDFALLDRRGALLGNPYHYRDSRTDGMVEEGFRRMPREEVFQHTGIQVMQINTLFQLLSMVLSGPRIFDAAETLLTIPDLFNYWLSGRMTNEFTNATTTQCFNPRARDWAWPVLERFGIPRHIFHGVSEPGTVIGSLRPDVAAELGAPEFPIVLPACHDTGSAVAAVPAEDADFAWLSSGTWSIMGAEVRQPDLSAQALAYNFTNEGGVFGTWRLSKNIMGLWIVQECKRQWNLSYDELTRLAADARPFLAVIDPDHDSFLHPGNMPEKIRRYCTDTGQPVPETQGEIIRAVLESLALKYRFVLERLEQLAGKRLEPLHIIGGGTRNRLLNQFTADAANRVVVTGPVEATAIGNVLVQAHAMGQLASLADARAVVRRSFAPEVYRPRPDERWECGYECLLKGLR